MENLFPFYPQNNLNLKLTRSMCDTTSFWIKNKVGLNAWKCAPEPNVIILCTPASPPARFRHDIIRRIT